MATRPAPAKSGNRPPAPPPAPKPPGPRPPAASAPKPPTAPAAKPTSSTPVRNAGGQPTSRQGSAPAAKPPKPKGNPGPGRSWVFKNGSWVAERKTVAANVSAPAGATGGRTQTGKNGSVVLGAPASDADTGVDTGGADVGAAVEPPVTSKTPEQIQADITSAAQSEVAMRDPALQGQWTSGTMGLGGLGFGYTKAGGGAATYNDIFGSLAPGAAVDRNAFEVRDALGRVINTDILNTDVYGGRAATDIAGTALGNAILESRRGSARAAEERSAGGITGGGLRTAAGEVQKQQQGAEITGLLGKLYGLESDITSSRTKTYQDALESAAGGDIGRWAPETETPASTGGSTSATPTAPSPAGRTALTGGPAGTFMKEANAARAAGTPKQKIQKLTALLNNSKYNLTDLQKKTIKQMITNIQKKKK